MDKIEWIDQKDMFFEKGRYKIQIARAKLGMNEDGEFFYQYAIFDKKSKHKLHTTEEFGAVALMNRAALREYIESIINKWK